VQITIPWSQYGQLFFANCKDIEVSVFDIVSYTPGIIVAHSNNIKFNAIGLDTAPYAPDKVIEFYNCTECEVKNSAYRANECINVILSSNFTIQNNDLGWSDYGISISSSTDCSIFDNDFENQQIDAIVVSNSEDISLLNNTFFSNRLGIDVYNSRNVLAANNRLDVNIVNAIRSWNNEEFKIYGNSIWGGEKGIVSEYSRNSSISNNQLREISDACISLYGSDNLTVNRNNCGDSEYGIIGGDIKHSVLDNNEFYHTDVGIFIEDSNNCNISRTYSATSLQGIWIVQGYDILVKDNTILNANIGIFSESVSYAGPYESYGVVSSKFINNTCMYGVFGIKIIDSSNCSVENNNLNYNDYGLNFQNVDMISILNNSCLFNNELGIWIQNSINCTFRFNLIQNNTLYGISFENCHNNTLSHNAFLYNNLGGSSQAYDDTGTNFWYNIGLGEGNYWSGWNSGLGAYSIDGPGSAADSFPLDSNPL